ncbi:MAG TPA: hypothetical protein VGV90_11460 [Solirubrobacteraceae bacterium]|nr:hypothetical protein [Solirubrobacteraceae bacterium]
MASLRKERIAQNENSFRELNESLESSVHRRRSDDDLGGFVCECGNDECEDIVRMRMADYEDIRQDSRLFFVEPGHDVPEAEDVVRKGDGYWVVRKHVDVAEITEAGDRRTAE